MAYKAMLIYCMPNVWQKGIQQVQNMMCGVVLFSNPLCTLKQENKKEYKEKLG
jgi:hypothetical protein